MQRSIQAEYGDRRAKIQVHLLRAAKASQHLGSLSHGARCTEYGSSAMRSPWFIVRSPCPYIIHIGTQ